MSKGRGLVPPAQIPSVWGSEPTTRERDTEDDSVLPGQSLDPLPGLNAYSLYSPENLHVLMFNWLNETFPHPENRFVNGAQGGVGAGYYGWCFSALTVY